MNQMADIAPLSGKRMSVTPSPFEVPGSAIDQVVGALATTQEFTTVPYLKSLSQRERYGAPGREIAHQCLCQPVEKRKDVRVLVRLPASKQVGQSFAPRLRQTVCAFPAQAR